ncbi:hypothetical protein CRG98_038102 [Punica granatum]|uniref:Uncharacterized protein n=1 Tax=Punica granatum TaxID=22663 RepID=A0A2I0ICT4_PUNGR|nr:hypothetical protein CRG98_038102 [Punica granatum]
MRPSRGLELEPRLRVEPWLSPRKSSGSAQQFGPGPVVQSSSQRPIRPSSPLGPIRISKAQFGPHPSSAQCNTVGPVQPIGPVRPTSQQSKLSDEFFLFTDLPLFFSNKARFRVPFTCQWIGPLGSPVRKGICESSGVSRLKQDASETRPDVSLVTLAPGEIFRVPHWAPFDVPVIR